MQQYKIQQFHINSLIDEKTGAELFKPQINQNVHPRERENLYDRHKKIQEKKNKMVHEEIKRVNQKMKERKVNKQSEVIVKTIKQKAILNIFNILDGDRDGEISTTNIETFNLPPNVLDIFRPLFEELEELNEGLDMEEFIDATNRLYEVSNCDF